MPTAPRQPSVHRLLHLARVSGYNLPWEASPAAGTTVLRFTPQRYPNLDVRVCDGNWLLTQQEPELTEHVIGNSTTTAAQIMWVIAPELLRIARTASDHGDSAASIHIAGISYRFASAISLYEYAGDAARMISVASMTNHDFDVADQWAQLAFAKYRLAGLAPEEVTATDSDDDISFS